VVLAIGNPFGVGQTVTMGIVSAKGRADLGIEEYEDFIQTDAAINPGNSGGALVDTRGRLVGINTAIFSPSGGNMGIGFAIPTDMARPIMKSLVEQGRVNRGWLGIEIQDVTRELADTMHLPNTDGVLVTAVAPNGAAARAGLASGDVILEVKGQPVNSTGQLRNAVASAGGGAKVKVLILREGKRTTLEATLGEMPGKLAKAVSAPAGAARPGEALSGVTVEALDSGVRRRLQVPDSVKGGVVVSEVQAGSPADHAGLRRGDVIVQANRKDVTSGAELASAARGGKAVLLLVFRDGVTRFLAVKP
jgi:serine protease Do